ncbi:methyl-accepting chemotaxis protein [Hahella sp. CR1]|uniref:methyl-accepting chemotaxis protein n=1 Tax=Hahella sp. CR1 TaxID=2992807 RepID=UPI00244221CC|nr:methyl-accepting chemotaxis protein [Hahella sp. CR1]MDG9672194.1 methyl-accepting chemotaxis protein [Hahella sp. CR1]
MNADIRADADAAVIDSTPSLDEDAIIAALEAMAEGDYLATIDQQGPVFDALTRLLKKLSANGSQNMERTVKLSIEANETAILSANLLYNLRIVDQRAHSIAAAAEEMRASVGEIKGYGESISQQAQSAQEISEQSGTAVRTSLAEYDNLVAAIDDNVAKVNEMARFANQVQSIADNIKSIAFQTKILSLNASVEAARAGDAGRGFSVVAAEVGSLAAKSDSATKGISNIVKNLQEEMGVMIDSMNDSCQAAKQGKDAMLKLSESIESVRHQNELVTDNTRQIATTLNEQMQAAQEVSTGITEIASSTSSGVDSVDNIVNALDRIEKIISQQIAVSAELNLPKKVIKLAQSDHVIWKKRLANMIVGKEGLTSSELADHHSCRLGKWYDKVSDSRMKTSPPFKALVKPHQEVHYHGKRAVDLYNKGDIRGALKEISLVEDASVDVLSLLGQLEKV